MKIQPAFAVVTAAFLLGPAEFAAAQRPSRNERPAVKAFQRPTTSPYLNLLGGGRGSFEFEYFRRVRPELEFRRTGAQLTQSVRNLQRQLDQRRGQESRSGLGTTGHRTSFLNYSGYYNLGRFGSSRGGPGRRF